jgi:hypothetical protein
MIVEQGGAEGVDCPGCQPCRDEKKFKTAYDLLEYIFLSKKRSKTCLKDFNIQYYV